MSENVSVFFYGLFLDESVLALRGISPSSIAMGYKTARSRFLRVPEERGRHATEGRCGASVACATPQLVNGLPE